MKSNIQRVQVRMLNGTEYDVVGTYMPLADKVAFERKWKVPYESLFKRQTVEGEDGTEVDITIGEAWFDERGAFFAWRMLQRDDAIDISSWGHFETWVEQVDRIEVNQPNTEANGDGKPAEVEAVDPTAQAAQPTN